MSPSGNQRRANPVVTTITFQLVVAGVASRSRFTTPTFKLSVPRIVSAIGRMESVLPVPVPATIPNPFPAEASSRISWPCCFSRMVGIRSPSASSIVSQAARVGAMTISRPVGGSAATKAARSGGRYLSVTMRCIRTGRCIHRTRCETAPGILLARGRRYVRRSCLVLVLALALALAVAVAVVSSVSVAFRYRVAGDIGLIAATRVARAIVVVITALRFPPLLILLLLLLPHFLLLLLLRLLPLLVVGIGVAGAEDREGTVRVTTGALDHQVAICIANATLVDRVVVATLAHLIPAAVDAIAVVVAVHVAAAATENDVADGVGALGIVAIGVAAIVGVADGVAADDRHVAIPVTHRALNQDVAVPVGGTALVYRVSVAIPAYHAPRPIDTGSLSTDVVHGVGADDRHVTVAITRRALHEDVAVTVLSTALIDCVAVAVATDHAPRPVNVYRAVAGRYGPAQNLRIERRRRGEGRERECDYDYLHFAILRVIRSTSSSVGLDLLLSFFPFFAFGGSSPKRTLPFAGRFLTADAQSVGAGCCPAGTPLIQTRHMPAGGKNPGGTICSRSDCDC